MNVQAEIRVKGMPALIGALGLVDAERCHAAARLELVPMRAQDDHWLVPINTVVTTEVLDDTLPGGPRQVTRTFKAPFARASREDDYRTVWAFFEEDK